MPIFSLLKLHQIFFCSPHLVYHHWSSNLIWCSPFSSIYPIPLPAQRPLNNPNQTRGRNKCINRNPKLIEQPSEERRNRYNPQRVEAANEHTPTPAERNGCVFGATKREQLYLAAGNKTGLELLSSDRIDIYDYSLAFHQNESFFILYNIRCFCSRLLFICILCSWLNIESEWGALLFFYLIIVKWNYYNVQVCL